MKALFIEGHRLTLGNLVDEQPLAGFARIRVRATGICATDLHILSGRIQFEKEPPRVLGHEIAGTVDAVGDDSSQEWLGKKVVVDPVISCGHCFYCRCGRKLLCLRGGELGTTGGDGGYAEYVNVPVTNLYELPIGLSFEEGALIEPLNCTYGAFRKAMPRPAESALIIGCGPAGQLFLQLAIAHGCSPVMMIGGSDLRLRMAQAAGATHTWNHLEPGLTDDLLNTVGGEGPDIVIEASGTDSGVRQAMQVVRPGGRIVLYGITGANGKNLASDEIIAKDLTIVTGIGSPLLWHETIKLIASRTINVKNLVTHTFALEECARAIEIASDCNQSGKVVFRPLKSEG